MANVDAPRGARPVKHLNGNPWNGEFNIYCALAGEGNNMFVGDFVAHGGTADPTGKYPAVIKPTAGTGNALVGVIIGFGDNPQLMANVADLTLRYRPASTLKYVAVVDDPDVIFSIQEDSTGGAIAVTAVGNNTAVVLGAGNTSTGLSGHELDSSEVVATTEQLRILRLDPKLNNDLGTNAEWLVLINEHEYGEAAGA